LRQVIVNLGGNSIKFTEKGEVVILVEIEEEENTSFLLHFMVSDTGIGIPSDKLKTIFESFSQVDASTTRKYGGTGLGLSISQQLVEMMGGKIWVESPANCLLSVDDCQLKQAPPMPKNQPLTDDHHQSRSGPGSTFHFTLRFKPSSPETMKAMRPDILDLSGMRVLIVDDNAINRLIIREIVSSWGLVPTEKVNGEQGLSELNRAFDSGNAYHLLLLDAQMPGMDGFEVAKRLKDKPVGADLKIIMLTSMGGRGDGARCKEMGISGYLLKPVKKSVLLDAVMMALGRTSDEETPVITTHSIEGARRRLRILLSEDNLVNQKLAVKILEKRGHEVIVAATGRQAVEAYEKQWFDVILMDVQMPEMDGFEATGFIRKREAEKGGHIPIVAMTAHAMKGDRERCLEAGMDDYVSKPIKPDQLFAVIETATAGGLAGK
jgi:CheY-like chemotaxis protein